MTRNQIEYWRNVETKRSNLANEKETNRSNLAREKETNRHNLATEQETRRKNDQDYFINLGNLDARRKELLQTQIRDRNNYEISKRNARTAEYNAETTRMVQYNDAQYKTAVAAETARSNRAREGLTAQTLAETQRSNMAREDISQAEAVERARSNKEQERLKEQSIANDVARTSLIRQQNDEARRHNTVVEQETHRSNITRENIDKINATANMMRGSSAVMEQVGKIAPGVGKRFTNLKEAYYLWQIRK